MTNSVGLIESKGLVALVEAADVILKNSPVKILGIKKLDNGLVSLAVLGDSEYVKAAVESATEAGRRVGEIYAQSVIDNPDDELLNLLSELFDLKEENISEKKKVITKPELKYTEPIIVSEQTVPIIEKLESKTQKTGLVKKEKSKRGRILKDKSPIVIKEKIKPEQKIKTEQEYTSAKTLSTIERLRKEALGLSTEEPKGEVIIARKKKDEKKQAELSTTKVDFEAIKEMNVHKLRHYARAFENFPIKGRQISRANRDELVELFKTMS